MLSVDIRHRAGSFALNARFEAPAGITVLFGRSGSGKTTIVNAVAGLLTPEAGRIEAGDRVLLDRSAGVNLPPHLRRVGYIFQEARLFPHLTVRQNLRYGGWFAPREAAPVSFGRIVDTLGIGALLDRRPAKLSGGERQRVAIGRALLASPRLLLADEPLAALDASRKEEVMPYFERLRDEVQVPILYVSHDTGEVARLATTVIALQDGMVLKEGTPTEVLSDPAVTPLGAAAAFSLVTAEVTAHHPDGISTLAVQAMHLQVPQVPYPPGTQLRVRIEAKDVLLAVEEPRAISALNVLPATLLVLRAGDGPGVMAQLDVGGARLLARITRRSCDALALRPGQQVFAIIKAVSFPREAIRVAQGDRLS